VNTPGVAVPERPISWHAITADGALRAAGSAPDGLSAEEVERRRGRFGPNVIEVRRPLSAWAVLRNQFGGVVTWLLVAASALALALGDPLEAGAIGIVLAINVTVGFWTEWRARIAVESLRRLQVAEAVVVRSGRRERVDAMELVPGDVILLGEGAATPADARLLEASELRMDESALTGESMPVSKTVDAVVEDRPGDTPVGDRASMVFRGTTVVGGAGRAVVTATGAVTELGRIGALVGSMEHAPTPVEQRLDALGRRLVWLTLGVAVVVIGVGLLGGRDPWLVVETGLALAIAAVPEGLPVVATITLAVGMWRMARRNALVRRPPAVEALGSATVICSDKTGTLTSSRMVATTALVGGVHVEISGTGLGSTGSFTLEGREVRPDEVVGLRELARSGVLANEAELSPDNGWSAVGDPTDVALLVLGAKLGLFAGDLASRTPEVGRLPFSSLRMLMASFNRGPDDEASVEVHVKGATDRLLPRCVDMLGSDGTRVRLDEERRRTILGADERFAEDGLRVIAVASGRADAAAVGSEDGLRGLTLLGLVGLMDPPTEGVAETIARFRRAGLRTVMITGDQPATARSVAVRLGMLEGGGRVVSGVEVSRMDDAALREAVADTVVFGRVSPEHKLRIVEALQSRGEVVGMLGDGVNDAPALQKADIGVAMGGRGTDVAKDVADLVLADDRLETVGAAVEEGRVIFDNIRKFIFYLFSCNLSEVGVMLGASLAVLPLPLAPLQLLWLNVVTDVFPALALSAEPSESDVMARPPRPKGAVILSRGLLRNLAGYATVMTLVTLGVFVWALQARPADTRYAGTLAFMTLAMSQLAHVLNAKRFGALRSMRDLVNPWLWAALVLGSGLQMLAVYHPVLQRVLGTVPLGGREWLIVLWAAAVPVVAGQAWKHLADRLRRK